MILNNDLIKAIIASLEAGKEVMSVYNSSFNVEIKNDNSPLTEADKKANTIINKALIPTQIPIISEENKQIDYITRKTWNKCWVVDPVDGTKEFIKRNGEFTVNIALVENKRPVLGVIYVPASKTLYFGDVYNKVSYKVELDTHISSIDTILDKAVRIQSKDNNTNKITVVGSRSHMNDATLQFVEEKKSKDFDVDIISKGSSLKFCLVAEGLADFYPRFAPTMEWDTAAGQAICEAAGLQVISQQTNKPLEYNKEDLLNSYFLVKK